MKLIKTLTIITLILLASVSVMAGNEKGRSTIVDNSNVKGLEKGLIIAYNASHNQQMEQVMDKIQERQKTSLNEMNNLHFMEGKKEGKLIATGKRKAKFLGIFMMDHSYRYSINDNGELIRDKYWHDLIWGEIEPDITEEIEETE